MDKHAQRIDIFNSTLEILRRGWYNAPSGRRVELPSAEEVTGAAVMYEEQFHVMVEPKEPVVTEVRVEEMDCVLAAKGLIDAKNQR